MRLLQPTTKIWGSYRRSHHSGFNLQVFSKIKLEAAFVYEIFGHTSVQVSAQLTLIDVFVLSSRAIGWLAPRIVMPGSQLSTMAKKSQRQSRRHNKVWLARVRSSATTPSID